MQSAVSDPLKSPCAQGQIEYLQKLHYQVTKASSVPVYKLLDYRHEPEPAKKEGMP